MTKTDTFPQYLCMDGSASRATDSFYAIYERELSYVWKTLGRLGVDPSDLADAVHDVFVIVHRRWADIDFERPIRPWLFGIARRVAAGLRRKR
ncbi:MAG TPA: sigma-70 family RNA polymerase sigma factor, partial [Kofleriaceae bacterium]